MALILAASPRWTSVVGVPNGVGVSTWAAVVETRARLIGHGVIAAAGMGELEFTVPYLAEYLRDEL